MAEKITLVLGSHAHVPYGSEADEFEKVYKNLLLPFVSALNKYPQIQAALHYSGVLLHWVERSHPELFMLFEDMMARKQIEMLGGGFYEPMLPIIPSQDRIGQIELLTTYLRKQFGKRPLGCWVPAFAWEQSLVSHLAACGMNFTFLGERQFALAKGEPDDGDSIYAPCLCEDQGKLITVFPVLQPPQEAPLGGKLISTFLEDFRMRHLQDTELVVSIFPPRVDVGSRESVDAAWNRFFEEISRCESFVETVMPGKLAKSLKNMEKLCFPDSSCSAGRASPRRFIISHPEAGGIYSKMVFTNVLINQLRGDKSRKDSAHEELWKAQSSSLFCQIGRQGLHNNVLRNAAYGALLGAERVTREKGKFSPSLVPFDFNMDGTHEWLFQDAKINCYVQSLGGGIFEMDYLPKAWNYLN
ncbi:MAG: alpha-amylase, partial [Treponema sp.]|nr:alpha-amylase [Treponema sp.]